MRYREVYLGGADHRDARQTQDGPSAEFLLLGSRGKCDPEEASSRVNRPQLAVPRCGRVQDLAARARKKGEKETVFNKVKVVEMPCVPNSRALCCKRESNDSERSFGRDSCARGCKLQKSVFGRLCLCRRCDCVCHTNDHTASQRNRTACTQGHPPPIHFVTTASLHHV